MLFVLEHDGAARLAAFRAGRRLNPARSPGEWRISLVGLNLDSAWEKIIVQTFGVTTAGAARSTSGSPPAIGAPRRFSALSSLKNRQGQNVNQDENTNWRKKRED
jgi:hypothetical protein